MNHLPIPIFAKVLDKERHLVHLYCLITWEENSLLCLLAIEIASFMNCLLVYFWPMLSVEMIVLSQMIRESLLNTLKVIDTLSLSLCLW